MRRKGKEGGKGEIRRGKEKKMGRKEWESKGD